MEPNIIAAFIVGAGVGAGIFWAASRNSKQEINTELEQTLASTNDQFDAYRSEVNEHFMKTAKLVSNLTESYKEVHEYLANSAMQLSNLEISRNMIKANGDEAIDINVDVSAPKDYAPKKPNDVGTLSESFGLEKPEQEEQPTQQQS